MIGRGRCRGRSEDRAVSERTMPSDLVVPRRRSRERHHWGAQGRSPPLVRTLRRLMPGFSPTCPECQRPWDERPELVGKVATDFSDCAFRCHHCGLAFSNATSPQARVLIARDPELNVPREVRIGLKEALACAATVGNRTKKRKKFCSARSEDAVTWTVVHALLIGGSVGALIGDTQLGQPQAVLLWGHPVAGVKAADVAARLVAICDDLGEDVMWRSEPDVIALWPQQLVFVEAKYGSGNDRQPNYKGYATYLPAPGVGCVNSITPR
jgi:hypothetical protein